MVQAVLLAAFFILWALLPDDRSGARARRAYVDINGNVKTALGMFDVDCGRYPTSEEGLKLLVNAPVDGSLTNWRGPYVDDAPSDPWGREYVYRFPGVYNTSGYDLYSLGPDGISKAGGNDPDDIANWEKPRLRRIFGAELLFDKLRAVSFVIPVLFILRLIVGFVSPRFRAVTEQNRWADWVWFAMTVVLVVVLYSARLAARTAQY